jgi:hypothetical protein
MNIEFSSQPPKSIGSIVKNPITTDGIANNIKGTVIDGAVSFKFF